MSIVYRGEIRCPDSFITWFQFSLLYYSLLRKRFIFSILIKLNWFQLFYPDQIELNTKEYSTKKITSTYFLPWHGQWVSLVLWCDVSYLFYFSIITVFYRSTESAPSVINAAFAQFTRSFSSSFSDSVFYLSRSHRFQRVERIAYSQQSGTWQEKMNYIHDVTKPTIFADVFKKCCGDDRGGWHI